MISRALVSDSEYLIPNKWCRPFNQPDRSLRKRWIGSQRNVCQLSDPDERTVSIFIEIGGTARRLEALVGPKGHLNFPL
jgi:hypothetical protein